jgi:hypothetical protein
MKCIVSDINMHAKMDCQEVVPRMLSRMLGCISSSRMAIVSGTGNHYACDCVSVVYTVITPGYLVSKQDMQSNEGTTLL